MLREVSLAEKKKCVMCFKKFGSFQQNVYIQNDQNTDLLSTTDMYTYDIEFTN